MTAASVAGIMAAGVPAQAATTGWRVSQTVGARSGITSPQPSDLDALYPSLVATGRHDAWALWSSCPKGGCGTKKPAEILEHWNGSTWSQRRPAALQKLSSPAGLGASSASDVWVFDSKAAQNSDLHYDGRTWSRHSIPSWVVRINRSGSSFLSVDAFGPKNVWVFSLSVGADTQHFAARYNGRTWRKATLPAVPTHVSVVSRSDIWAVGYPAAHPATNVLMHWNGKRWTSRTIPAGTAPSGSALNIADLGASGASSAWVQVVMTNGNTGNQKRHLLHWNGKTWRRASIPASATYLTSMTPDGHGGVWMAGIGMSGSVIHPYFYHRSGAGHWARYREPVPAAAAEGGIAGLARIPGTTSMLAAGQVEYAGSGEVGVLWRYRA